MNSKATIEKALRTLILGLSQGSSIQINQGHRKLYMLGEKAIPIIEEKILSQSWSEIKYGEQLSILSGLLILIRDINEERAKEVVAKIRLKGCHKMIESRMRSITEFTLRDYYSNRFSGINLYISKELNEPKKIERIVLGWLSMVPTVDLNEIERIYIVPETEEDHRGWYMPVLNNIVVEWRLTSSFYRPLSYIFLFQIEKTLYHEIGHHACKHFFGYNPEQEAEADQYAVDLLKKNHPFLWRLGKKSKSCRK